MEDKYAEILDEQGFPLTPDKYLDPAYAEDGSCSFEKIESLGSHYQQLAEDSWNEINLLFGSYKPSFLLAGLSYLWFKSAHNGDTAAELKNLTPHDHDVEFCQQIYCMHLSDPGSKIVPTLETVWTLNWHIRLLLRNIHIQSTVRLNEEIQHANPDNDELFALAKFIQIQTRGNTPVTTRTLVFDNAVDLASYFDFEKKLGITGKTLVEFMANIGVAIQEKINAYTFYEDESDQAQLIINNQLVDCIELDLEQLKTFCPADINHSQLETLMSYLLLDSQPFTFSDIEQVLLHRKARRRPFSPVARGRYLCACPDSLLLDPALLVFEVASQIGLVKESVFRKIATNLEQKAFGLFSKSLPSANVFSNVKWKLANSDDVYEVDLLVYIDGHLLVVEAKSGRVTEPSLRGSESRLKRDVHKLVGHAGEQVLRFIDKLPELEFIQGITDEVSDKVKTLSGEDVYGVIVTQHQLGYMSIGTASINDNPIRSISIQELEIVFESMHSEAERLFYFNWRKRFEKSMMIVDEITLINKYINSEFDSLQTVYRSVLYDYELFRMGELEQLTGRRFTPRWVNIIQAFKRDCKDNWLWLSFHLLGVDYKEQLAFEEQLDVLRERVLTDGAGMKAPCMFSVLLVPSLDKTVAICPGICVNANSEERNRAMSNAAEQVLGYKNADVIFVFGIQDEFNDADFTSFMYVNP